MSKQDQLSFHSNPNSHLVQTHTCAHLHQLNKLNKMAPKIEVAVPGIVLGEGPHWVAEKQELVYVDIIGGAVHRHVPATGKDFKLAMKGRPSLIVPVEGSPNNYVVGLERELVNLEWDGESAEARRVDKIVSVDADLPRNRFNDGKCDPQGRLWAGTMGSETSPGKAFDPEQGNLFKLDKDGKVTKHAEKIGISNGLAWSADSTKFYYIDSLIFSVDVFDFDAKNGTLSNRRVLFDLKKNGIDGFPDGMAIDSQDNLWVAVFNGAKILHIDGRSGALIDFIDFTGRASKLTSVAFGGPNLDILYVTSAKYGLTDDEIKNKEPDAGALFKVTNVGAKQESGGVNYKKN